MRSVEAVQLAFTAGLVVHALQGDGRQQYTPASSEKSAVPTIYSPTFPRSHEVFSNTIQLTGPYSPTMLQKEQELSYRPLVVIYADGLYGGEPKGRPFYEAIQKNDLRVPWIAVIPTNPNDPDPLDWKTKTYAALQKAVAENNDVLAIGYSAGSTLWGSMLNDLLDPASSFYDLKAAEHIKGVILFAAPDVTSNKSAQREKISKNHSYQKFFGISPTGVARVNKTFGSDMTIIVGVYDDELLYAEGKTLAAKFGATLIEVEAKHGMNTLATSSQDPARNPETVAISVFEASVITHRKAQGTKLTTTK
ncbi:hypothetical protein BH11PAT1_BH11PAT1_0490 [soil metagenome]